MVCEQDYQVQLAEAKKLEESRKKARARPFLYRGPSLPPLIRCLLSQGE